MKYRLAYYFLVLSLMIYFCVPALFKLWETKSDGTPAILSSPVRQTVKTPATLLPLDDYGIITERNLFGSSRKAGSASNEEISLDKIPLAPKKHGLRLVGTVVADVPLRSVAIIDHPSSRKQETYHEGDRAGQVLIKKVLRNAVIINDGTRDELLTMVLAENEGGVRDLQQTLDSQPSGPNVDSVFTEPEEAESFLTDLDKLMAEIREGPFVDGITPKGFQISKVVPGSIFERMGLQNGDVIQALENRPFISLEPTMEFYDNIMAKGSIVLRVERGGRKQELHVEFK